MLILIVGPSGAGKDTLIEGARAALGEHAPVRFVRRVITRPASAGGEEHDAVSEAEFMRQEEAGEFAIWWRAHGLYYGIPADISMDLSRGIAVIANVSRAVLANAAERFPVGIIEVTAPAPLLAARLEQRGREDALDIARRLSREIELPLPVERRVVMNDGTVEQGIRRMLDAIRSLSGGAVGPVQ